MESLAEGVAQRLFIQESEAEDSTIVLLVTRIDMKQDRLGRCMVEGDFFTDILKIGSNPWLEGRTNQIALRSRKTNTHAKRTGKKNRSWFP